MSETSYEEKYTRPDLRREIKEELMSSDKGGRPGEWSARKAQLLVQEYERRGGGYKQERRDEDAQSLQRWTEQNWQTADGSAYADDGSRMKRYLPERAWDLLSDREKQQAKQKKQDGDRQGKQFVENTAAAKAARAFVDHGDASELTQEQLQRLTQDELMEIAQRNELSGRSEMSKEELAEAIDDKVEDSLAQKTRDELYEEAKRLQIQGRSKMNKSELLNAVRRARSES